MRRPARISGVVRDPQQAVIPGAQVSLTNTRTAVKATTTADAQGRYRFTSVAPDTYVVEVQARGFQLTTSPAITQAGAGNITQDFSMVLAGETESVTVTARAGAEGGYRTGAVGSLGSSGDVALLDAPYTVSVLPRELIDNGQVKNFKEASKFLPLVHFQEMQGSEVLRPETRGMQGSNMQNARMDGMGIVVTGANSMETLQQIEVLNGVGGALYGPANPSGMFNFVPKRPTDTPVRQVTFGYDDRAVGTIRADVGGRVGGDKRFGYRANMLFGDGASLCEEQRAQARPGEPRRRRPALCAIRSSKASTATTTSCSAGFPGWFTYGRANARSAFVELPSDAPDPSREGLGQESAGLDLTSNIAQLRVRQQINSTWRLSIGVLNQRADRDISTQVNALTSNAGNYTSSLAVGFAPQFRVLSDLASLNGRFQTGAIRHDVAIGSAGYRFNSYSDVTNPSAASVLLGSASITAPVVFALPASGLPLHNNIFFSSKVHSAGHQRFGHGDLEPLLVRQARRQPGLAQGG